MPDKLTILPTAAVEANRDAVELLTEALELAKSGRVIEAHVAMKVSDEDGQRQVWSRRTYCKDTLNALGALRLMEHELLKTWDDPEGS